MSRNLRLQVIMNAVDRVTRPLKNIQRGSGKTAQALRASRDQLRQLEQAQKNLSGFANLKRTSDNTSRSLNQQQQRVRALTQQIQRTEGPTRQLNRQRDAAIRQAQQLKTRYQQEQQQLQILRGRIREAGGSTRDLGGQQRQLAERIRTANQQMRTQQQRLDQVAQRQRRAAEAAQRHQRAMGNVGRMAGVGAGMLGGGIAKGYAASRLLDPGLQFDATMSRVQALARLERDDPALDAIRAQARELGASTAFTSSEVGEGQAFLAMAGFNPDDIRAAMPGLLDLARAGDMALGDTADIASNILTSLKLPAEEMNRVADVMAGAFTRSNTSIASLGETMKYAAPSAAQFGVDLETVTAMAAKLGDSGLQGSMGGTGIRRVLSRLAAPTGAAAAALESLGAEAEEIAELGMGREALQKVGIQIADPETGGMRDTVEILKEIYEHSRRLSDIEQGKLWNDIAGETGAGVLSILVEQAGTGGLEELRSELFQAHENSEAASIARVMSDHLGGDWDQLKSAWQDAGIEVFTQLSESLRETTQRLTEAVRGVGDWARANPGLVSTIAKLAGALIIITTVGGALTMMMASVLGPIVMARHALQLMAIHGTFLAKTALPAVLGAFKALGAAILAHPIIAIVAALALGALYVWRNWESIGPKFAALWQGLREGLGAVWENIKAAFEGGIGGVTRLLLDWSPLGLLWRGISAALGALGIELPITLSELGGAIINGMISGITGGLGRLRDTIASVGSSIIRGFTVMWDGLKTGMAAAQEGVQAGMGAVWENIKAAFEGGIGGVTRLLLDWSPLGILWRGISAALGALGIELPITLSELGGAIINGMISGITGGLGRLRDAITGMGGSVIGWFKQTLGINSPSRIFAEFGGNLLEGLIGGIDEKWSVLRDAIGNTAGAVTNWFKERLGINSPSRVFAELGGHTMEGYEQGIEQNEQGPLREINAFAKRLQQAGAGLALAAFGGAAVATPGIGTDASPVAFDTRPPLQAPAADGLTINGGINIEVHPSAGMDEQALARLVGAEVQRALDRAARDAAARQRSAFYDND